MRDVPELPVLVTAQLTFDTGSNKLVKGESAIVYGYEEGTGGRWWLMMSIDRPRLIRHYFSQASATVYKRWLKPDA